MTDISRPRTFWRGLRARCKRLRRHITGLRILSICLLILVLAGYIQDTQRQNQRNAYVQCVADAFDQEARAFDQLSDSIESVRNASAFTQRTLNELIQTVASLSGEPPEVQQSRYRAAINRYLEAQVNARKAAERNPLPEAVRPPRDACRHLELR